MYYLNCTIWAAKSGKKSCTPKRYIVLRLRLYGHCHLLFSILQIRSIKPTQENTCAPEKAEETRYFLPSLVTTTVARVPSNTGPDTWEALNTSTPVSIPEPRRLTMTFGSSRCPGGLGTRPGSCTGLCLCPYGAASPPRSRCPDGPCPGGSRTCPPGLAEGTRAFLEASLETIPSGQWPPSMV